MQRCNLESRAYNLAYRMTGSQSDAVKILDGALATAARTPAQEPGAAWFLSIVARSSLEYLQQTRLRLAAGAENPVQRALLQLSPEDRLVVILKDLLHCDSPMIGQILGCDAAGVSGRLNQARHSLRFAMVSRSA